MIFVLLFRCKYKKRKRNTQLFSSFFVIIVHLFLDISPCLLCNIKQFYGDRAMSIFVQPPSIEELRRRLNGRGTDLPEVIEQRLAKANYELSFAPKFDRIVVNDDLETAKQETHKLLISFLNNR